MAWIQTREQKDMKRLTRAATREREDEASCLVNIVSLFQSAFKTWVVILSSKRYRRDVERKSVPYYFAE